MESAYVSTILRPRYYVLVRINGRFLDFSRFTNARRKVNVLGVALPSAFNRDVEAARKSAAGLKDSETNIFTPKTEKRWKIREVHLVPGHWKYSTSSQARL